MPISKLAAGGSLFANAALLALVLSSQNFQFGEDLQETAIELQEAYCFVGTATVVANNGRNMESPDTIGCDDGSGNEVLIKRRDPGIDWRLRQRFERPDEANHCCWQAE